MREKVGESYPYLKKSTQDIVLESHRESQPDSISPTMDTSKLIFKNTGSLSTSTLPLEATTASLQTQTTTMSIFTNTQNTTTALSETSSEDRNEVELLSPSLTEILFAKSRFFKGFADGYTLGE